jgi:hypothetical protein
MKRLLYSTVVLFLFSISIVTFNLSCEKQVLAQNTKTTGEIYFFKPTDNKRSDWNIWKINEDGTNETMININKGTLKFSGFLSVKVSPNGTKLLLQLRDPNDTRDGFTKIYTCNLDGTSFTKVTEGYYLSL